MKKEIIISCFLILMLTAALINIKYLNNLTDDVNRLINEASTYAQSEDWVQAEKAAEAAAALWSDSDSYTHVVLRHSEIESATDSIYGLLEQIYARQAGATRGAAQAAIARLESLSAIEQIKLGSIF